jgi:hypothetical protein
MRTPTAILAGSLLLAACGPGPNVVYVPAPTPTPAPRPTAARPPVRAPAPAPAPQPVTMARLPIGVTIVRADESRLLVDLNQPAYLAVFEIVPNRGVTVLYPASARRRQVALSGSAWLPVSWRSQRDDDPDGRDARDARDARGSGRRPPPHYVYAVASDRPLRLTDAVFDDDDLRDMLGSRLYRGADPYETMDALSRRFVPPGRTDEQWGEDLYTMNVMRRSAPMIRVAPDSVVASNGNPIHGRGDARMRPPVYRVPRPGDAQGGGQENGGGRMGGTSVAGIVDGGAAAGSGREGSDARPDRPSTVDVRQQGKPEHPSQGGHGEQKPEQKPEPKPPAAPKAGDDAPPRPPAEGPRGIMERARERAHPAASDTTDRKEKPKPDAS